MKILHIFAILFVICSGTAGLFPELAAAQSDPPFGDISNSFAKDEIIDLYERGIVTGTGNHTFEPKKPIARAEFIALLMRMFGMEPVNAAVPAFSDVPANAWYYGWVYAALHLNIANGTGENTASPMKPITRQEAAALVARALKQDGGQPANDNLPFADADDISGWAKPLVASIRQFDLMSGDESGFRPHDPITREETAAVLSRILRHPRLKTQFDREAGSMLQIGWQYNEPAEQFIRRVEQSNLDVISPRWFFLDRNEWFREETDQTLYAWAKQSGMEIWAMLGNRSDAELTHDMLSDDERRAALVRTIADRVQSYGLDGINVDFENVAPADRIGMTAFIRELAEALHALQATLSVNVSPDLGSDWTAAFDYQAVGEAADYIVLMGYDEHWNGAPSAGSVSSLPWLRQGIETLLGNVSAGKTILALPFYTRDWTLQPEGVKATDMTLEGQNELMRATRAKSIWNSTLGQYVAGYKVGSVEHRLWLEDGRSLSAKSAMASEYGIAGIAYWHVGAESPDIWASLKNAERFALFRFGE